MSDYRQLNREIEAAIWKATREHKTVKPKKHFLFKKNLEKESYKLKKG